MTAAQMPPRSATPDESARAETLLAGHRDAIDRLDAILVYTLAERFAHTRAVGQLKAEHALPPSDPAREARQAERLDRLCGEAGLDPAFARTLLGTIIAEVIRQHQTHQQT